MTDLIVSLLYPLEWFQNQTPLVSHMESPSY